MKRPTFHDVREADRQIQKHIHRTPILTSQRANRKTGSRLFFKCENFQRGGAFKIRGALNALRRMSDADKSRGVITDSSGNHAQALALAAKIHHTDATVVIPENAPPAKVDAARSYGAAVHFCAPTQQARRQRVEELIDEKGSIYIPSYDHPDIIAGQGTVGYELFKEIGDLDMMLVPVGGGGLLSGIALAVKQLNPDIQLIGVEPALTDDARQSFRKGEVVPPERTDTVADGLRTSLSELTLEIIRDKVDDIITVEEASILEAMRYTFERLKIVIEPSAAVPLAALFEGLTEIDDQRILLVVTGGNADLDHLPWNESKSS